MSCLRRAKKLHKTDGTGNLGGRGGPDAHRVLEDILETEIVAQKRPGGQKQEVRRGGEMDLEDRLRPCCGECQTPSKQLMLFYVQYKVGCLSPFYR